MKQKQNQTSTQQLTFNRPNPPTPEAVAKAQFIDKTFHWVGSAATKVAGTQPNN